MEIVEFSIIDIRIIQSLWEKKPVEYIANMLDRPYAEVNRKIEEMLRQQQVTLYQRPQFTRKINRENKELAWAQKQLEKVMEVKPVDLSGKISVRINSKTIVFVNPGADIEAIKKRYNR